MHFILALILWAGPHQNHGHHYGQHEHAATCVTRVPGVYYRVGVTFCDTQMWGKS